MADCETYNCDAIGTHEILNEGCKGQRPGGFSKAIVLECDHAITDPSSESEINTALGDGTAYELFNVKIGIDAPTPVTSPSSTSCGSERTINNDHTMTIEDYTVTPDNVAYWSTFIGGRTVGGIILQQCTEEGFTDYVTYIDSEITFSGGRVTPNTNAEPDRFEITGTWREAGLPTMHASPPNIFD